MGHRKKSGIRLLGRFLGGGGPLFCETRQRVRLRPERDRVRETRCSSSRRSYYANERRNRPHGYDENKDDDDDDDGRCSPIACSRSSATSWTVGVREDSISAQNLARCSIW